MWADMASAVTCISLAIHSEYHSAPPAQIPAALSRAFCPRITHVPPPQRLPMTPPCGFRKPSFLCIKTGRLFGRRLSSFKPCASSDPKQPVRMPCGPCARQPRGLSCQVEWSPLPLRDSTTSDSPRFPRHKWSLQLWACRLRCSGCLQLYTQGRNFSLDS